MNGKAPIFDQRGQQVVYQYNSAGNINIKNVSSIDELIQQIENIKDEAAKIVMTDAINKRQLTEIKYNLESAQHEIGESKPTKHFIQQCLEKAKQVVENVSVAVGLVEAIDQCVEKINQMFS